LMSSSFPRITTSYTWAKSHTLENQTLLVSKHEIAGFQ